MRARAAVLTVVLAVLGLGTWLLVHREASSRPSPTPSPTASVAPRAARLVTAEALPDLASEVGHPVFWLGERRGRQLEWAVRGDGAAILRYLRVSSRAADPALSVASYPLAQADDAIEQGAQRPGAISDVTPDGAVVTAAASDSTNAYYAVPGLPVLAEVFSPEPGEAYELIRQGELKLVPQP